MMFKTKFTNHMKNTLQDLGVFNRHRHTVLPLDIKHTCLLQPNYHVCISIPISTLPMLLLVNTLSWSHSMTFFCCIALYF